MATRTHLTSLALACFVAAATAAHAQEGPKIFISVDMEGIGGIGTGRMTSAGGS